MSSNSTKLRILFVTPWYPTVDDPVSGVFVHEFCRSVAEKADVCVITLSLDDDLRSTENRIIKEEFEGLSVVRFTQGRGAIPKARYISRLYGQIKLLNRFVTEFSPDLIHASTYHAAIPAVIAGRKNSVPVISTEHYSGFYRGMVTGVEKLKARWGLSRSDCVAPISRFMQSLLERHGVRARFEVIPIGIDVSLFQPDRAEWKPNSPLQAIMVASLAPIKGYIYLLDALAILKERSIPLLINVVGDGADRKLLEQKSADLGIESMIRFHGVMRKAGIASLMNRVDFAVSSTLGETFGAAIAEGLAIGLPTVATKVGALPELIDDNRGLLVEPADGKALAEGIGKLIERLEYYDRHAIAQWTAGRFAHDRIAGRFIALCNEIVKAKIVR